MVGQQLTRGEAGGMRQPRERRRDDGPKWSLGRFCPLLRWLLDTLRWNWGLRGMRWSLRSTKSDSQSIRLSSSPITTNIPTGMDSAAGSNSWLAGTSGLASGLDLADDSGSVVDFGSGSMYMSGIRICGRHWVCLWMHEWGRILIAGSYSTSPTAKEDPSTQRVNLMFLASISPGHLQPDLIVKSNPKALHEHDVFTGGKVAGTDSSIYSSKVHPPWNIKIPTPLGLDKLPIEGILIDAIYIIFIF